MKRINIALGSLMLLGVLFSCSKASLNYTQNGNWVSRATFAGIPMGLGTSFVIGNSAYVGTGYNPVQPNQKLKTIFRYDPATINTSIPTGYDSAYGSWTQVAVFGGVGRQNAVGFNVGNYGYIGTGTADGLNALADFWKYDPSSNSWSAVASLGHAGVDSFPRIDAVSFSFDTTAYVLTGYDYNYYLGDVWKYSPATNTWTKIANMPGSPRSQASTWVYNKQGYLLTGYTSGGQWTAGGNACYDFWKFDPANANQPWTRLRDIYNTSPGTYDDSYTNIVRYKAASFVIKGTASGDKGYITTGQNGQLYTYTWEYDFATDLWTEKTPFEGAARQGAVGFTVMNRGFVATGFNGGTGAGAAYSDCREFFPNQVYNQYD